MIFNKQVLAIRAVIIAMFIGIVLLVLDAQKPAFILKIRSGMHTAMSPIYAVAESFRFSKEQAQYMVKTKNQLYRENQILKAKIAQQNFYLQQYANLVGENAQLRGMINYVTPVGGRIGMAAVIGIDNNPIRQILVLNQGAKQDVFVGQVVLDQYGIMGQIINVYANSSRAMLISDREHALSVAVQRTGDKGVVQGIGNANALKLDYINKKADIKVGDKIVTSGLGKRFPQNYLVGTVSKIDKLNEEEFMQIRVKPSANLSNNGYLMLLYKNKYVKKQHQQMPVELANEKSVMPDTQADHLNHIFKTRR